MTNVEIVSCSNAIDAHDAADFLNSVWGDGPEVVPMDLILAMTHVGGYCSLARRDGTVVGASVGFLGKFRGHHTLHSHVTASREPGIGYELKQHQRTWAQQNDISMITWTFDPLVRRNGYFNLVKLGAIGVEYSPNFYGEMVDAINTGDESDRVMAIWNVADKQNHVPQDAQRHTAIDNIEDSPVVHGLISGIDNVIHIPADVESMRAAHDPRVAQWRSSVRDVLMPAVNSGWTLTGMINREAYILTPPKETQ